MRYDMTALSHVRQLQFLDSVKDIYWIEDNYYQVTFDCMTNEFLLIKIGYVVKNNGNN